MRFVFLEAPVFTRLLPEYLDDEGYRALQITLMQRPHLGPVVPGTGGFRKLRWHDDRRGKGKRGGLRIIYYVLEERKQIWLFSLYDKNEIQDLTAKQCRLLKLAVQAELEARRGKR